MNSNKYGVLDEDNKKLKEIGKECKRIRKNAHVTMKELSLECGYSYSLLKKFESGGTNNLLLYLYYMELL